MPDGDIKRTVFDTAFCSLFRNPQYQLEAYKEIHPEDTKVTVKDIKNVTLNSIFLDGMYNDLGFTVGDRSIMLFEEQTNWSRNLTVRALMYAGETYNRYLYNTKQDYYTDKPVKLPKPEFYMLYTGEKKYKKKELSLAETYWNGDNSSLDLTVKVLYGDNQNMILSQYVKFTKVYRTKRRELGESREAILATLKECKEKDILKEYIEKHEAEVIGIMMSLFNMDIALELHDYRLKEESRQEGVLKTLTAFVKKGIISIQEAAQEANMSETDFCKIAGLNTAN